MPFQKGEKRKFEVVVLPPLVALEIMPLSFFVPIFYLFIHLSTHHDGTTEEALLQGEDDGEGYKWKVLRGGDGAIDVFYGRGSASKLQLRREG